MNTPALAEISVLGQFMADGAARSLVLLRQIDATNTLLHTISRGARSFSQAIDDLAGAVHQVPGAIPEHEVIPIYESLQANLADLHREMKTRCVEAERSGVLRSDDGVCEAFRDAMKAVEELHECVETFGWLVMEHNASLEEPNGPVLTNPEEIERYLAAL